MERFSAVFQDAATVCRPRPGVVGRVCQRLAQVADVGGERPGVAVVRVVGAAISNASGEGALGKRRLGWLRASVKFDDDVDNQESGTSVYQLLKACAGRGNYPEPAACRSLQSSEGRD